MSGLRFDPWLTSALGRPAYHWAADESACLSGEEELDGLPAGPAFVDAKIPANRPGWLAGWLARGFRLIDTQLTFERAYAPLAPDSLTVRPACPHDVAAVREIARTAFRFDRFHVDTAIGRETADRIKTEWATNFFRNARGDALLVAEEAGIVAGFILLLDTGGGRWVIDLIAVMPELQGQGVGRALVAATVNRGTGGLTVGTQLANTASVRFYEGLGFRLRSASYVLHLHRPGTAGPPDQALGA